MPRDHRFVVRVYYEDTDFSGFVYHANYLKFFERGRSEALRAAGVTHTDLLAWETPAALVVRHMEIEFLRPGKIDDVILVTTRFVSMRGARMFIAQTMERGGDVLAKAALEVVLINLDGRPRRIPPELAKVLDGLMTP
jgi:acyl-CoA thioester hydrolase